MNKNLYSLQTLQKIFATMALFALVFSPFVNVQFASAVGGPNPNPGISIEQCRNGSVSDANDCLDLGGAEGWANGNAGSSNSHYIEGQSIAYRTIMTDLPIGTPVTLTLGYAIVKGDHNAIDYLTSYDLINENVDPISGVSGIVGVPSTFTIPAPSSSGSPVTGQPTASFNALSASDKLMSLWNGTITSIAYNTQGDLNVDSDTLIDVTFTPTASTAVLAWGGHIASRLDWGYNGADPRSAGGISGSSYHMIVEDWSLSNPGKMDRSLSADAVVAPGNLIVIKDVINDNGGTAVASDFTLNVTSNPVATPASFSGDENGTPVTIQIVGNTPTSYTVSEDPAPGYTVSYSADCIDGTINTGENKVCIVTNNDNPPPTATLTLVKNVNNQEGGSAVASSWTLTADSATTDISGAGGVGPTVVDPGIYALSESGSVTNYQQTGDWSCVINDLAPVSGNSVELANGDVATCTVTNSYVPPAKVAFTVTKNLVTDNGGTETVDDFSFILNGVTHQFEPDGTNVVMLDAGTYTVVEDITATVDGRYDVSHSAGCTPGALAPGGSTTCTITNDDITPELTVIKTVINDSPMDNDIIKNAGDFTMNVTGTNVSNASFPGVEDPGTKVTLDAGAYSVDEGDFTGYKKTLGQDCSGTIDLGESKTCTITNDDNDPTEATITVNKVLVKDYGGDQIESDFSFKVNGADSVYFEEDTSNDIVVTSAGIYNIVEDPFVSAVTAYSTSHGESCSNINVVLGNSYSCTITNIQLPACRDGIDNDDDGLIDFDGDDPGCDDPDDNTEVDPIASVTIDKEVTGEGASTETPFTFWGSIPDAILLTAYSAPVTYEIPDASLGTKYFIQEPTEKLPSRWNLESIVCTDVTDPQNPSEEIVFPNDDGDGIDINLFAGEKVSCVFTNHYTPRDSDSNTEHIIVRKEVTEGSDTSTIFSFDGSWADDTIELIASSEIESPDLHAEETYSVSEIIPDGWDLQGVVCESDQEVDGVISPSEITLADGETVTCTFTNDQRFRTLTGYKFNDANNNGVWDDGELGLSGWTIEAVAGDGVYQDLTDQDGFYSIQVPEIASGYLREVQKSGWTQTAPEGNTCEFSGLQQESSFLDTIISFAQDENDCTFGNHENTGGGGGGGSSPSPRCDAFDLNGDVLSWETRNGYDMSITQDGDEIFSTEDNDETDEGSFELSESAVAGDEFVLTVNRGSKDDTCTFEVPAGEVLGESTEILPIGAPDTGAGGASPVVPSLPSLLAILALGARRTKNA